MDKPPYSNAPVATLRKLTDDDQAAIEKWPSYPPQFMALDYALRAKVGWLAKYPESAGNNRFAAEVEGKLVGFSILTKEAEFYVAVHPDRLAGGIGSQITRLTKERGFDLGFERIWLKVRTWHRSGIRIYERMGYSKVGSAFTETVNGREDTFIKMEALSAKSA